LCLFNARLDAIEKMKMEGVLTDVITLPDINARPGCDTGDEDEINIVAGCETNNRAGCGA
jgi:hypothetical protein